MVRTTMLRDHTINAIYLVIRTRVCLYSGDHHTNNFPPYSSQGSVSLTCWVKDIPSADTSPLRIQGVKNRICNGLMERGLMDPLPQLRDLILQGTSDDNPPNVSR